MKKILYSILFFIFYLISILPAYADTTIFKIPTIVLKTGSKVGDYTTSLSSYSNIDSTNLSYTYTVPTGYKMIINFNSVVSNNTLNDTTYVAIFEDSTNLITCYSTEPVINDPAILSCSTVFTGDNISHSFTVQWMTNSGSPVSKMYNGTSAFPTLIFQTMPSN